MGGIAYLHVAWCGYAATYGYWLTGAAAELVDLKYSDEVKEVQYLKGITVRELSTRVTAFNFLRKRFTGCLRFIERPCRFHRCPRKRPVVSCCLRFEWE
jgi:hypothetical protein